MLIHIEIQSQQEKGFEERDALIDLTLMQPVLASFMLYLPEQEQDVTPDDVLIFWFGQLDEEGQATV